MTAGLAISTVGLHTPGSPAHGGVSSVPKGPLSNRNSSGSVDGPAGLAPATPFFHANDARSAVSSHSADERPKPGARAAAFFYANEAAPICRDPESPRPVSRDIMKPDDANKFFYANEHQSSQAPTVRPGTAGKPTLPSTYSPRFPSPEVQRNGRPAQRPPSPLKESSCTSAPATLSSPRSNTASNPGIAARHENPVPSAKQQGSIPRRASLVVPLPCSGRLATRNQQARRLLRYHRSSNPGHLMKHPLKSPWGSSVQKVCPHNISPRR